MSSGFKFDFNFVMKLGPSAVSVHLQSNASTVAIRAPSGSGKTAFIRIIAGLNKNFKGNTGIITKRIGYVPQDSLLIPTLTVRENLLLSPYSNQKQLMEICEALSIGHLLQRRPRLLSGGEKQRVSIGRALLSRPELLILDEPFAALDYEIRNSIATFIKDWTLKNKTDLILVTHDEFTSEILCEEFWTIKRNILMIHQKTT